MSIEIKIDRERCAGYANCLEAAPKVFDLDEHDIAVVIADASVVEANRAEADFAARLCPRQAIIITEGE